MQRGDRGRAVVENGVKTMSLAGERNTDGGGDNPLISLSRPRKLGIKETPVV